MAELILSIGFDVTQTSRTKKEVLNTLKDAGLLFDGRTHTYMFGYNEAKETPNGLKNLYYNYMTFLSHTAINLSKLSAGVRTRDVNQTLAYLEMGFIPLICEPTCCEGTWRNEENMAKISNSGLPTVNVQPLSFTTEEITSNLGLTDTLVNRLDAAKILHINKAPNTITVKDVWEALGLC